MSVSYHYLSRTGRKLESHCRTACFSALFNRGLPLSAKKILLTNVGGKIKFTPKQVDRYVKNISELGFNCSRNKRKQDEFVIDVKHYKTRAQILSTLNLLRYLGEGSFYKIVKAFFEKLDREKLRDKCCKAKKFKLLEEAQRESDDWTTGHMATYNGNGSPTDLKRLFEKFKRQGGRLYGGGYFSNLNSCWHK